MRMSAEQSRSSILQSALSIFCERGYRSSTLAEIGAHVGVTRGAVLHHFHSKSELLAAVVEPARRAVATLLDATCAQDPPTRSQRRQLLTDLLHLFVEHRSAFQLLATDVGARNQLGFGRPLAAPSERLVTLLVGSHSGTAAPVRVASALGALILPVVSTDIGPWLPKTSAELVDSALAVLQRPLLRLPSQSGGPTPLARVGTAPIVQVGTAALAQAANA
jgi:AcrR family transcriptional regulator